jgi:hypothetical protein
MEISKRYKEYIQSEWYKKYMENKSLNKYQKYPSDEYKHKLYKKSRYEKRMDYLKHKRNA